jgi:hypothetical protein
MKNALIVVSTLLATPVMLHAGVVEAQGSMSDIPGYVTESIIDGSALSNVRGRFAVNMVAGDSNVQANAAAVALGTQDGPTIGQVGGIQVTDPRQGTRPDVAVAIIGGKVFTNSSGLISVNQTSGVGNTQANGAAFAMGFEEVVAESVLSATTSNVVPTGAGTGKSHQAVSIDDSAFNGARGLVQVNQSAGSGNSTVNNFSLQLQLGAKP